VVSYGLSSRVVFLGLRVSFYSAYLGLLGHVGVAFFCLGNFEGLRFRVGRFLRSGEEWGSEVVHDRRVVGCYGAPEVSMVSPAGEWINFLVV